MAGWKSADAVLVICAPRLWLVGLLWTGLLLLAASTVTRFECMLKAFISSWSPKSWWKGSWKSHVPAVSLWMAEHKIPKTHWSWPNPRLLCPETPWNSSLTFQELRCSYCSGSDAGGLSKSKNKLWDKTRVCPLWRGDRRQQRRTLDVLNIKTEYLWWKRRWGVTSRWDWSGGEKFWRIRGGCAGSSTEAFAQFVYVWLIAVYRFKLKKEV